MTPPPPLRDPDTTPLARKIASRLASGGPISVHDYIEACLYDSECGYYRTKAAIGQGGDFVTAPEISQVFGELIGLWAGEVWRQMGEPARVWLVELGPGRGTLMADAIRALKVVPGFLSGATVHLVETSKTLQDSQRAALAQAPVRICWHDDLKDVPDGPAIFIANEFFDCLPVQQFVFDDSGGGWRERMVGLDGSGFRFAAGTIVETPPGLDPAAATAIEDGAILECRPAVGGIIDAFAARSPFAALIIDYGYSRLSIGDTVQAVRAHRFAGLFDMPGENDITAHVDFLQLKQAAERAKMKTFGPMPMGEWLLRLGLEARVRQLLGHASEEEANEMRGRVARLVDPAQMGVLFKVLALTNGIAMSPPPFE
jgi:SAM-dependent MidA family methyltransferase